MADVFRIEGPEADALAAAEAALASGGIAVLPTDTVYGVGARPDLDGATARIFEAKRRPRDLTLPVLVASLGDAREVADVTPEAERLAGRFWPGPLTLVLPRSERARSWELGDERETVGVRVPAHEIALALLAQTGPLAVTSANVSGEPTPPDCDGVLEALGDAVDVYLCAGPSPIGVASTVVDLTSDSPRLLREGTISEADILATASPER